MSVVTYLTKIDSFAKKNVSEFEKKIQLDTKHKVKYFELQLDTKLNILNFN